VNGGVRKRRDVAVLVLGCGVVIAYFPAAVIPVLVAEFSEYRTIRAAEISKRKDLIVEVKKAEPTLVEPIIARVIDHHIQNDANGKSMAVLLEIMGGFNQINQVLLRTKVGVNAKVIVNVVTMICVGVVLEDRREPNRRAAQTSNVIQVSRDAFDVTAEECIRCRYANGAATTCDNGSRGIVLEAVDQEKVDEFFAPFAVDTEVFFAGNGREIDVV